MLTFAWTILYVPDVAQALEFYERAFGLTRRFLHESGGYGELDTGATVLAFASEDTAEGHGATFRPTRPDDDPPAFEVAFTTDDVPAAFERARAGGATPVAEPAEKPWGQTVSYVRDLNGVLVEIATPTG